MLSGNLSRHKMNGTDYYFDYYLSCDDKKAPASAGVALKNTQEALAKFKLQTHEAIEAASLRVELF